VDNERRRMDALASRLAPALLRSVTVQRTAFRARADRMQLRSLTVDVTRKREALTALSRRFAETTQRQVSTWYQRLEATDRLRETLGYKATLARGYAVVRDGDTLITTQKAAALAGALEIEFSDGRYSVDGPARAKPAPKPVKPDPKDQGSLF
jgi:exodeoxyribonuclease VII large subunit